MITKNAGHRMLLIMAAAIIGFGFHSLVSVPYAYADGEEFSEEQYYEDSEMTEEMADEIHERQRNVMSELEELKAQTRITRDSMVDTTTGPQTYFEDVVMPDTTTEGPDGKKTKKVYKYDKKTGTVVPQRLFNNVR